MPVNDDFFPEGSDECLLGDLSHSDCEDSSIVRGVQTASQRKGHVRRLDQVEVRSERHPYGKTGDRFCTVDRSSMHCSLFDADFCHDKPGSTCSRIDSKVPAPHKPEGRDPDQQDCNSPLDHRGAEQGLWEVPSPLEEGSGMKPLWLTSIPSADFEKGQGAGAMSKPANHKVKCAHCSVEHPGLFIDRPPGGSPI